MDFLLRQASHAINVHRLPIRRFPEPQLGGQGAGAALCEPANLVTADQQIQAAAAVPVVRF
jgi:hypothetical protein